MLGVNPAIDADRGSTRTETAIRLPCEKRLRKLTGINVAKSRRCNRTLKYDGSISLVVALPHKDCYPTAYVTVLSPVLGETIASAFPDYEKWYGNDGW